MLTVVRYSLLEALRKRVLAASGLLSLLFLGLFGWMLTAIHPEAGRVGALAGASPLGRLVTASIVLDMGLFFCYVMVALFAILSVAHVISGEAESGRLLALATRPVSRRVLYLGQYLAHLIVIVGYTVLLLAGLLLLTYHRFGAIWGTPLQEAGTAVSVIGTFLLMAAVMAALAMLGSIWLLPLANSLVVSGLFFVAFLIGSAAQLPLHLSLSTTGIVSTLLWPSDGLYRRALYEASASRDGLLAPARFLGPFGVSHPPSALFVVYAIVYWTAILWAGQAAFTRRDL